MSTYIDDDRDVIPAIIERPPTDAIGDVLALDAWLADTQERTQRWLRDDPEDRATGAQHGFATDLRALIASWVAGARQDAARVAEEERSEGFREQYGEDYDRLATYQAEGR